MTAFASKATFSAAVPFAAIVAETPSHVAAREALLDAAMGPGRTRKSSEAIRTGRLPAEGLAFSALAPDGTLVGTVRLWNIAAGTRNGGSVEALLLGPLAIAPDRQGTGLGGLMMRHAIAEAARLGHGAIVLVGDPDYYVRFGFSAAQTGALAMPGPFEPHRLLALELSALALDAVAGLITATGRFALDTVASPPVVAKAA
ncbi:N-acetyltransferase [Jiella sp. MQZ9-1]|uniref:N-acetyltransferase n=1 Tax=Jiella flava TaxID=2816857 RepID=A0A939JSK3_9HYPH|nr:N-acetyltransferase [Jiella flava]MBO0663048.1 N-acetyltransferase [Jiella flava]MCD2471467.1 N-acetyltransferase [Jiella flava]